MNDLRGHTFADLVASLNAQQHLAVDAVVAFVDGELGAAARDRAAEHLAHCPSCAAEVVGQCQTRTAVRSAGYPPIPANLLATLRDIPQTAELPPGSERPAVTDDGTLVTVTDSVPAPLAPLGTTTPLGGSQGWGTGSSLLGRTMLGRRIGRAGAGVMVSGLVLGALIMTMLEDPVTGSAGPQPEGLSVPAPPLPSIVPIVARAPQPGTGLFPGDHGTAAR